MIAKPSLSTDTRIFSLSKASYWMAFLCSALNPYIYGARNPAIRKEFKLLLCCMCPFLAKPLKFKGCGINSSKGSWGRMGPSDDSNDFQRYNFAYAPQGRGGSLERMRNSIDSNEEMFSTYATYRDASWEGTGTSKTSRSQQNGFAYGSQFMGAKRNRPQVGWGHKRFRDSSISEGNQYDTITELNRTSFNDRRARKASLQLRFEDNFNLEFTKKDAPRTSSSFYVEHGNDAGKLKTSTSHQHQENIDENRLESPSSDDVIFDQQFDALPYHQSAVDLSVVSKKSSFLERRHRKGSLQLRFEDNKQVRPKSPTRDESGLNQTKKYSHEERRNHKLSFQLRFDDNLESPTSDAPLFDQRKSSFSSDIEVGVTNSVLKKTSFEERHNRKAPSQLPFENDFLESPTSSDVPFFNDQSHSFTDQIDDDDNANLDFYKTSFSKNQRICSSSLKPRFEDNVGPGLHTTADFVVIP